MNTGGLVNKNEPPQDSLYWNLWAIYADSHQYLRKHLDKISNISLTKIFKPDIEVNCIDGSFQVYLIRLP